MFSRSASRRSIRTISLLLALSIVPLPARALTLENVSFADSVTIGATQADAYCGFLFFWLWVAWREQSTTKGALWFVLIMALGNLAMASYVLLQLRHIPRGETLDRLFSRKVSP